MKNNARASWALLLSLVTPSAFAEEAIDNKSLCFRLAEKNLTPEKGRIQKLAAELSKPVISWDILGNQKRLSTAVQLYCMADKNPDATSLKEQQVSGEPASRENIGKLLVEFLKSYRNAVLRGVDNRFGEADKISSVQRLTDKDAASSVQDINRGACGELKMLMNWEMLLIEQSSRYQPTDAIRKRCTTTWQTDSTYVGRIFPFSWKPL
ncbi:MAG: hypothetical protein M3O22_02880 [Pseudomonadota bacterium]|nr:hypothetical protein [Pseudomonadota bacterium]